MTITKILRADLFNPTYLAQFIYQAKRGSTVSAYGAVWDGVTDDSAAIQEAINTAALHWTERTPESRAQFTDLAGWVFQILARDGVISADRTTILNPAAFTASEFCLAYFCARLGLEISPETALAWDEQTEQIRTQQIDRFQFVLDQFCELGVLG